MHDGEFSFRIPSDMLARDASKLKVTTSDQSGIVSIFEANWNDGRTQPNLCKKDERSVRGEVDYFDGQVLRGWALNPDDPGARLSVALIIDGRLVQLKEAATLRADLRKHGTDGRHGFMFEVPTDLIDDDHSIISVRSTNPSDGIDRGLFSIDRTMLVEYSMKKLELQLKKLDRLIV